MMLTSFNILICGSSNITYDHIEAIKKIKELKISAIYSGNIEKVQKISQKNNIRIIKDLKKEDLSTFDIALITSSTSSHLKYLELLSSDIKNIIVEKPIVCSNTEFNILKSIKNNKNILFKEVTLFDSFKVNIPLNSLEIKIRKKRALDDYKNFEDKVDIYKSPIFNHLPHWFEFAYKYLGSDFKIDGVHFEKFDKALNFHKKIDINLINSKKRLKINLDFSHNKNYKNQLRFNYNNRLINLLLSPFNILINNLPFSSHVNTKNKIPLLESFYRNFLNGLNINNQEEYFKKLENKIILINKIWEIGMNNKS